MTGNSSRSPYLQGVSGQVTNQQFEIGQRLSIGSAADQALQLDDSSASAAHAVIEHSHNELRLVASEDVMLNGEIVRSKQLKSGDELRIGQQRFVIKVPGLRPDSVLREVQAEQSSSSVFVWLGISLVLAGATVAWYFLG